MASRGSPILRAARADDSRTDIPTAASEEVHEGQDSTGIELVRADQVTMEPLSWLWERYLARGKVHVLAGAPGTGKTTLVLSLAATLSCGGQWPDGTDSPRGGVMIWSGEDDPADTLVPRLCAMGADRSKVAFVESAIETIDGKMRKVAFDPAVHLPALSARVARDRPALLVIDPIVSAVSGDSHKNGETRRALQPLVDLARRHGVAVLGITHFSKGTQGRDPTERVTGSLAFGALARMVFVTCRTREDGRVFMKSKSNISSDDGGFEYEIEDVPVEGHAGVHATRVWWGRAVQGNARDVLAKAEAQPERSAGEGMTGTDEAMAGLRDVLAGGELLASQAKATMLAAGFTEKTTRVARQRLGVKIRREGFGTQMKSFWSLVEGEVPGHSSPQEVIHAQEQEVGTKGKNES